MPHSMVRLSAGRESMSDEAQGALLPGRRQLDLLRTQAADHAERGREPGHAPARPAGNDADADRKCRSGIMSYAVKELFRDVAGRRRAGWPGLGVLPVRRLQPVVGVANRTGPRPPAGSAIPTSLASMGKAAAGLQTPICWRMRLSRAGSGAKSSATSCSPAASRCCSLDAALDRGLPCAQGFDHRRGNQRHASPSHPKRSTGSASVRRRATEFAGSDHGGDELKLVYPQPGAEPARRLRGPGRSGTVFRLQPMDGPDQARIPARPLPTASRIRDGGSAYRPTR